MNKKEIDAFRERIKELENKILLLEMENKKLRKWAPAIDLGALADEELRKSKQDFNFGTSWTINHNTPKEV